MFFIPKNREGAKEPMKENNVTVSKQEKTNHTGYFIKRIGHTTYRVGVHFSETNTETARDKIVRLIRNGDTAGKAANQ
jgi:hypothetical protein